METTMNKKLSGLKKGRVTKPMRLLCDGGDGVGKSTLSSQAPEPIFICAEDGTSELEVFRDPDEPTTWNDIFEAIHGLKEQAPEAVVALAAQHEVEFLPPDE